MWYVKHQYFKMLTKWTKFWYISGLRAFAWDNCCPVRWDAQIQKIIPSQGYGVKIWWLWFWYFVIYSALGARNLLFIFQGDQLALVAFVIESCYLAVIVLLVGLFFLIVIKAEEFSDAGNIILRTDAIMQGNFKVKNV